MTMASAEDSLGDASVPPRLRRAVARCCLNSSPHEAKDAARALQEYLADPSTIDAVYNEILERGNAEPYSPESVANCARLLKSYLAHYTPSNDVLDQITLFTGHVSRRLLSGHAENLFVGKQVLKCLAFVRSLVVAHQGAPRPDGSGISSHVSLHAHPVSSVGLSRAASVCHTSGRAGSSHGLDGPGRQRRQDAVAALWHSSVANLPSMHRRSLSDGISATISAAYLSNVSVPSSSTTHLRCNSGGDMVERAAQGKHSVHPSWGGSSEGGLSALLHLEPVTEDEQQLPQDSVGGANSSTRQKQQDLIDGHIFLRRYASDAVPDNTCFNVRWSLMSAAEASISLAPLLVERPQPGAPASDDYLDDEVDQYVGVTDLVATRRYIATVVKVQRVRSMQIGSKDGERPWQQLSMLFQYRPYSEQAPLALSQGDVGAVVEAVKGNTANIASTTTMSAGGSTDSSIWGKSVGRGSMANVCSSLLIKVVMDMWLSAGPDKSFPVVLEMLLDMVGSEQAVLQERAFDILYNLSLHAQLLHPVPAVPASETAEGREGLPPSTAGGESGRKEDGQQEQEVEQQQPGMEGWLRQVLFALLPMLHACNGRDEDVWAAALGVFLHLTTESGTWIRRYVEGLSLGVVQGFLRAAQDFNWSPELHCHFIRLATNLIYSDGDPSSASSAFESSGAAVWWHDCQLNRRRLDDFGGAAAVLRAFMAAPTPECRQNLLTVLVDALLGSEGGDDEARREEVVQLGHLMKRFGLVELLAPLLLAPPDDTAHRVATWVSELRTELNVEVAPRLLSLLQLFVRRMAELAEGALNVVPGSLEPIVAGSTAAVSGATGPAESEIWTCLRELIWSPHPSVADLGEAWLFRVLAAAADRHAEAMWDVTAGDEGLALLPAVPATGSSKCKGITQQPGLSGLLAESLGPGCPSPAVPLLFLRVVDRLLHHIKGVCTTRDAASAGAAAHELGRYKLSSSRKVAASVLATFEVGVEWLLLAPPGVQAAAMVRSAHLLFAALCLPAHLRPPAAQSGAASEEGWAAEQQEAVTPVHAFLAAQTVIPHSLLQQVPLGLLVRLFNNFLTAAPDRPASTLSRLAHRGLGSSNVARGEVDWSFMGPSGMWTGTLHSALLLLIIGHCSAQPAALKTLGGDGWFHRLLNHTDASVGYYSAVFLLKRLMTMQPVRYHKALHRLLLHAQHTDDQELLTNPYLQISAMLEMKLVDG